VERSYGSLEFVEDEVCTIRVPSHGLYKDARSAARVDLPEPFFPTSATICPREISKETLDNTHESDEFKLLYRKDIFWSESVSMDSAATIESGIVLFRFVVDSSKSGLLVELFVFD
jgi:hypothetical protein